MRVKEKISGKVVNYPNLNIQDPVIGHMHNEEYYFIEELDRPVYDYRTHKLIRTETFTEELKHPHLPIYRISYKAERLSDEEIIIHLSTALGQYLDELYPNWERIKHNAQGSEILLQMFQGLEYDTTKLIYVNSMLQWVTTCRAERDTMEANLPALPSFNFSPRP